MPAFITPVTVTPSSGSWQDIDCSSYIPSTATGVILHLRNDTAGYSSICGIRKNGSTDTFAGYMDPVSHSWACIGVDTSRIFEAYVGTYSIIQLVGYFENEAVFFDNAKIKTGDTNSVRKTVSIAGDTGTDTAIAAILLMEDSSPDTWSIRKTGSSDNRSADSASTTGFIVGVDGSEQFDILTDDISSVDFNVVGYMTTGVTMNTNATDLSLGTTGTWADLSTLPSGATAALIEVYSTIDDQDYGLRKNGSTEDIYQDCADMHAFGIVEASSQVVEGKIQNTAVDFFLQGYFTPPTVSININDTSTVTDVIQDIAPKSGQDVQGNDASSITENVQLTINTTHTVTAKGDITGDGITPVTRNRTVTTKADITGESIDPVTRTRTVSAKALISLEGYGVAVTKPTYDAICDNDPSHYIFDSKYGTLKYYVSGTTSLTLEPPAISNRVQIEHGLGYIPFVELYTESYESSGTWYYAPFYGYGATSMWKLTYTVDSTYINIYVESEQFMEEVSFNVKYFIFRNELIFSHGIYVSDSTAVSDNVTI
jgi:hypothetical protein